MAVDRTRESQYQVCVELRDAEGVARLGLMTNQSWRDDPRHLLFVLSRYKFVAKMLSGKRGVLEIGCADAFGTRLVLQEVQDLTAVDFDPVFVRDAAERMDGRWPFECKVHDMLERPLDRVFEAAYALDVIEHIPKDQEDRFIGNIVSSLVPHGVLLLGSPSLQSQVHASAASKQGHVNCKDHRQLRELLAAFFHNVFIFSMNDEVVHTGYSPMAQYLLGIGCSRRDRTAPGQ
jgi:hypothetical protein